ncbi:hypothetical protein FGO68_gene16173 [Halteria grandinella]|uniref:Uncharacterized protein n=1 Tax=Halteria grandinella TaxID=5974 RepID=A0A8J8P614_HALGN|nr:hypothetical protein FGO68_gene16173 [Halteria grandinella]
MQFKHEQPLRTSLTKKNLDFDTTLSETFIDSAKYLLRQCFEVLANFDSQSKRIRSSITQLQQKVQTILSNFQERLEVYLNCKNQNLKDQDIFIVMQQAALDKIMDQLMEY